jgi:hypothetical protein
MGDASIPVLANIYINEVIVCVFMCINLFFKKSLLLGYDQNGYIRSWVGEQVSCTV